MMVMREMAAITVIMIVVAVIAFGQEVGIDVEPGVEIKAV